MMSKPVLITILNLNRTINGSAFVYMEIYQGQSVCYTTSLHCQIFITVLSSKQNNGFKLTYRTVKTLIRRHSTRRLIRVFTVCYRMLYKNLNRIKEKLSPNSLNMEMDWSNLIEDGHSIRHKWVNV